METKGTLSIRAMKMVEMAKSCAVLTPNEECYNQPGSSNSESPVRLIEIHSATEIRATDELEHDVEKENVDQFNNIDDDQNFDDSVDDPNYIPSDDSDSSEINAIARMIERNIENELPNKSCALHDVNDNQEAFQEQSPVLIENKQNRKRKRNSGKSYVSKTGKLVPQRTFKELSNCRKKCKSRLSYQSQEIIFQQYWALGNYDLRVAFVSGLIELVNKKYQKLYHDEMPLRNRRHSCLYWFFIHGEKVSVCKGCLVATLGESLKFINTVIEKKCSSSGTVIIMDQRGKHPPAHKLQQDIADKIRSHINSFPAYESHYTRRDTTKKYLPTDLNITKMYRMYCDTSENSVSLSTYTTIFKETNLSFKKPKLDTCSSCDKIKLQIELAEGTDKKNLIMQQKKHQDDAEYAYKSKSLDKETAKTDSSMRVYTFDLQQCLPTPFIRTSISFYKRQLWTFNLTIHECVSNIPFNHMWHEAIGKRGGNEIASCLYKHINQLSPTVKQLIFYSDSCPGQNKNSYIASMFLLFIQMNPNVEVIDHKFLVVGHTHMECDTDHAAIEKEKKLSSARICHPRDWYNFVASVGAKKKQRVVEMTQDDFFSFDQIAKKKFIFRPKTREGNSFSWLSVRWLRYTKEFGEIQFKTSLDETELFQILSIRKRGINSISPSELTKCYTSSIKISNEKKKDLMSVLDLIDPIFHPFYQQLETDVMPDFHPDLTEEDPNEEGI